jgi:hypothetical protein
MSLQKEKCCNKCDDKGEPGYTECRVCPCHSLQKESEWELKLQEKIKENKFVTPSSHLDVEEIKSFIRETLSNREKEIAEEVEKLSRVPLFEPKETALAVIYNEAIKDVLSILKH